MRYCHLSPTASMMPSMSAQIRNCFASKLLGAVTSMHRARVAYSTFVRCGLIIGFSAAALTAQALALTGVQSRKLHGAGIVSYDLPVDANQPIAGNVTFESRVIGTGHRIVFQFDGPITSTGSLAVIDEMSATVASVTATFSGAAPSDIVVTIPALPDNKRVNISLTNVNGVGLNVSASLGFRLGDTNNSGTVTAVDVSSVKARSGQSASTTNFQYDLNTTGAVTAADIAIIKARSGLYLVNAAPVVSAGSNQTITLPAVATLTGTASDDGLPNPPSVLTLSWSRFSGPSAVTFGNASAASTTASFAGPGTYVLRLTANDSQLVTSSDVSITVNSSVLPGLFEKPHPWNKDVSALNPDARSANIITALQSLGGWGGFGSGINKLRTDFSIAVLYADSTTPRRTITGAPNYYVPDGDTVPLQMPLPLNGNTEGSPDNTYTCDTANNDCHVLVVERTEKKLYELYNATAVDSNTFTALGAFVWDLTKQYPDVLRGDQCTSADAAGLPMAALIPTADEVAAGEVPHALRFILPNPSMKKGNTARGVYVRPATHAGGPTNTTDPNAPPYGVRFRLKASFDEIAFTPNPNARVILRAMKKYGMILSDGGQIALTFADDRLSMAKWMNLGITAQTFDNIGVDQFDVVDLSAEIVNTFNCVRAP